MKRIFTPTRNGGDWKRLLAKPDLHWQQGRSAMTLAASWEDSHPRLPSEVASAVAALGIRPDYLAAFPEWQVALPGGATASQTDLLVIAPAEHGLAVIAIEGKVDEALGPTLAEKRKNASEGVIERLAFLHRTLALTSPAPDALRYQLLHRTASALLVAQEFHAELAVMLVHSFSPTGMWYEDFNSFAMHLGVNAPKGSAVLVPGLAKPRLAVGWVAGDLRHRQTLLAAAD